MPYCDDVELQQRGAAQVDRTEEQVLQILLERLSTDGSFLLQHTGQRNAVPQQRDTLANRHGRCGFRWGGAEDAKGATSNFLDAATRSATLSALFFAPTPPAVLLSLRSSLPPADPAPSQPPERVSLCAAVVRSARRIKAMTRRMRHSRTTTKESVARWRQVREARACAARRHLSVGI